MSINPCLLPSMNLQPSSKSQLHPHRNQTCFPGVFSSDVLQMKISITYAPYNSTATLHVKSSRSHNRSRNWKNGWAAEFGTGYRTIRSNQNVLWRKELHFPPVPKPSTTDMVVTIERATLSHQNRRRHDVRMALNKRWQSPRTLNLKCRRWKEKQKRGNGVLPTTRLAEAVTNGHQKRGRVRTRPAPRSTSTSTDMFK